MADTDKTTSNEVIINANVPEQDIENLLKAWGYGMELIKKFKG